MSAHAMLDDLVAIALRVTVLLTIAALADLGLRRRASATLRHMVWSLAVSGALALPLLRAVVPAMSVPILPATTTPAAEPVVSASLPALPLERRSVPPVRYETAPSPEST